jgi:hypothetical protein
MGLERRLVCIDFVEPDAVGIVGVLDDVEPVTARFILHGAAGVLGYRLDEPLLVTLFYLGWGDDDVYRTSST